MIKNQTDINDLIKEDYVAPESVFDKKRTKTSHFMLHSIFPNNSVAGTEYFVNAFIDDMEFKHHFVRPLFLVFKVRDNDNRWLSIIQRLRAKTEYVLEYFAGMQDGKNLVVVVFQVPEKFANDYLAFKSGKYSQFSDTYKKLFPRFIQNQKSLTEESEIWRVVTKSEALKKQLEDFFNIKSTAQIGKPVKFGPNDELWGIPELKYEVFRYTEQK